MTNPVDWQSVFDEAFAAYSRNGMLPNEAHRAAQDEVDKRRQQANGSISYTTGGDVIENTLGEPIGVEAIQTHVGRFDATGLPVAQWVSREDSDRDDV